MNTTRFGPFSGRHHAFQYKQLIKKDVR